MTNEERDDLIRETHDAIVRIMPMVKNHETTLYGNGKPGLKEELAVHIEAERHCPARLAYTEDRKKTNVATIAVIIAFFSFLSTVALGVLSLYKK